MIFTVKELLSAGSHKWRESEVDTVTLRNIENLCRKLNRLGYPIPKIATSCLRSLTDQKRINPKVIGSAHLYGCAVDISDTDGKLAQWCKDNINKLVECGLWMENPHYTKGWCHLQSYAPKSFNRIFNP